MTYLGCILLPLVERLLDGVPLEWRVHLETHNRAERLVQPTERYGALLWRSECQCCYENKACHLPTRQHQVALAAEHSLNVLLRHYVCFLLEALRHSVHVPSWRCCCCPLSLSHDIMTAYDTRESSRCHSKIRKLQTLIELHDSVSL